MAIPPPRLEARRCSPRPAFALAVLPAGCGAAISASDAAGIEGTFVVTDVRTRARTRRAFELAEGGTKLTIDYAPTPYARIAGPAPARSPARTFFRRTTGDSRRVRRYSLASLGPASPATT